MTITKQLLCGFSRRRARSCGSSLHGRGLWWGIKRPGTAKPPPGACAFLHTISGDRWAIQRESSAILRLGTPWGLLHIETNEIEELIREREAPPWLMLRTRPGIRLVALAASDSFRLETLRFGEVEFRFPLLLRLSTSLMGHRSPDAGR
ncbi:MAG: hypothetical protein HYU36_16990 [Planctomycetes bacterium]|nr:hypothetical protein [Planctomycetota bacterium]